MSKGGAGKVYFVLYLAVILELLIIFIERDEAEEGLRREQEQAIQIVQTILSQLQTGSGATDISANPKDQIVLDEDQPGGTARNYQLYVSVGDARNVMQVPGKPPVKGDDIPVLDYFISHTSDFSRADSALGSDTTDIEGGEQIFHAALGTEMDGYDKPRLISGTTIQSATPDSYFQLNAEATAAAVAKGQKVKVFNVNFQPKSGTGWYRLRFASQTNKILGIGGTEVHDDDTVRIGNVKLTVKQLKQVQRSMAKRKVAGQTESPVVQYINKLLEPGAYKNFIENKSANAFNIRVIPPKKPDAKEPVAAIALARDTAYWYEGAPFSVRVTVGPKEATKSVPGTLTPYNPEQNEFIMTLNSPSVGYNPIIVKASNAGKTATAERTLYVEKPEMKGGTDKQLAIDRSKILRATIGKKYNPSTEWKSTTIPADQYQTKVYFNGVQVFNKPGTSFRDAELDPLIVPENLTDPTKLVTEVYWKPNGTNDSSQWVKLLSNQPNTNAVVPLGEKRMTISWPAPDIVEGAEDKEAILTPSQQSWTWPMTIKQTVGRQSYGLVEPPGVSCNDCEEFGLGVRMIPGADPTQWSMIVSVTDPKKLKASINGKRFEVPVTMRGKGNSQNTASIFFTIAVRR
jgi:hypothetical protein